MSHLEQSMPGVMSRGAESADTLQISTLYDAFEHGIYSHSRLPPHLRQSTPLREFADALLSFCIDRCIPYAELPTILRDSVIDRASYAKRMLSQCRERLRLYPYDIIDDAVLLGCEAPLDYYSAVLNVMLKKEWAYDALPNFTAVDILRLFAIGRNEYINLLNGLKGRTARWLLKGSYVNDAVPRKLASSAVLHPAWIVRAVALAPDVATERLEKHFDKELPANFGADEPADDAPPESTSSITPPAFLNKRRRAEMQKLLKRHLDVWGMLRKGNAPPKPPAAAAAAAKAPTDRQTTAAGSAFGFKGQPQGPPPGLLRSTADGGTPYRACEFPHKEIHTLYRLGLVYAAIEVRPHDSFIVPPFEGFVMNRPSQDWLERLLYDTLAALDERRTLAEHARDLIGSGAAQGDGEGGALAIPGGTSQSSANLDAGESAGEPSGPEHALSPPNVRGGTSASDVTAAAAAMESMVVRERSTLLSRLVLATRVLSYLGLVRFLTPAVRFHSKGGDGKGSSVVVSVLGGSEAQRTGSAPSRPLIDGASIRAMHPSKHDPDDEPNSSAGPRSDATGGDGEPSSGRSSAAGGAGMPSEAATPSVRTAHQGLSEVAHDEDDAAETVKASDKGPSSYAVDPSWANHVSELTACVPVSTAPVTTDRYLAPDPDQVLADSTAEADASADRANRLCLLYDGPMAGRVMIAAQGAAHRQLKRAAVTLFEAGKLTHRFVEELLPLLRPIHEEYLSMHAASRTTVPSEFTGINVPSASDTLTIASQHETPAPTAPLPLEDEGHDVDDANSDCDRVRQRVRLPVSEAASVFAYVSNLYLVLRSIMHPGSVQGAGAPLSPDDDHAASAPAWNVDLVRVEHLNQLRPHVRDNILRQRYAAVLALQPLTVTPFVDASSFGGRPHILSPTANASSSAWLRMFVADATGRGAPMLIAPRGAAIRALPKELLHGGAWRAWTAVDAKKTGAKQARPAAVHQPSTHDGVSLETILRADNSCHRIPSHSAAVHVAAAARDDAVAVSSAVTFDRPVLRIVASISATSEHVFALFKRAALLLYGAPDQALDRVAASEARHSSTNGVENLGLYESDPRHVKAFANDGVAMFERVANALLGTVAVPAGDGGAATTSDGKEMRSASAAAREMHLGVLRFEASIDRSEGLRRQTYAERPSPLVASFVGLEFGVPLDPAGFDAVFAAAGGPAAALERIRALAPALTGAPESAGKSRHHDPASALSSRRGAPAETDEGNDDDGNEALHDAPGQCIGRLERRLKAFTKRLGAAPARPKAPAGDEAAHGSFVQCSELGGAVASPCRGAVYFDGTKARIASAYELGNLPQNNSAW